MPQLLVRDVPTDVVAAIKQRASLNGRSTEAEHRAILEQAVKPGRSEFWERARTLRAELKGRKLSDSTELLRVLRDSE